VSVIGRIAYWADLDSKATFGANVRSGKLVFRRRGGTYNPVVSDGKSIYLTGYNTISALEPAPPRHRKKRRARG
jgi:hypothetical protein